MKKTSNYSLSQIFLAWLPSFGLLLMLAAAPRLWPILGTVWLLGAVSLCRVLWGAKNARDPLVGIVIVLHYGAILVLSFVLGEYDSRLFAVGFGFFIGTIGLAILWGLGQELVLRFLRPYFCVQVRGHVTGSVEKGNGFYDVVSYEYNGEKYHITDKIWRPRPSTQGMLRTVTLNPKRPEKALVLQEQMVNTPTWQLVLWLVFVVVLIGTILCVLFGKVVYEYLAR